MIVLLFLLGVLVGAFLNLCADQLPRWRRLRRVPFCPYCEQPRPRRAWIATLAYLSFRPNCPHCGAPIPLRHPLTEIATGALYAFLWYWVGRDGPIELFLLYTVYTTIFVLVMVIDLEHRLILNVVMYPAWGLALLGSLIHPTPHFYRQALVGGALGFGLLFLIYLGGVLFVKLWSKRRGKDVNAVAFGFGDVRLGLFIGLALGFPDVLPALFWAILLGGLGGVVVLLVQAIVLRRYHLFTAIPYGPFLIIGAMAVMLFS